MENLYSIKITQSGRYIRNCDEHWYETSTEPVNKYTREAALATARQLRAHYIYDVVIDNGVDSIHCTLRNKDGVEPVKKSSGRKGGKASLKDLAEMLKKRK